MVLAICWSQILPEISGSSFAASIQSAAELLQCPPREVLLEVSWGRPSLTLQCWNKDKFDAQTWGQVRLE